MNDCKHELGFIKIRDVNRGLKGRTLGVLIGCANGCGKMRELLESGEVKEIYKKLYED